MSNTEKANLYTDENRTRIVAAQVTVLTVIINYHSLEISCFLIGSLFCVESVHFSNFTFGNSRKGNSWLNRVKTRTHFCGA